MKDNLLTVKSNNVLTISPKENEYSVNCLELFFGVSEKEKRAKKELEREIREENAKKEAFGVLIGGVILVFLIAALIILAV